MAQTIQQINDAFGVFKQDIGNVGEGEMLQWCNQVADFAYDHILGVDPLYYGFPTQDYSPSSSLQSFTLPTDFLSVDEQYTGFFKMDGSTMLPYKLRLTSPGSTSQGYYLEGLNVVFTGFSGTESIRLKYRGERTRFTAMTDFFTFDGTNTTMPIVPDRKLNYLISNIDTYYSKWDQDTFLEGVADQRFARELSNMLSTISRAPRIGVLEDNSLNYAV